MKKFKDAVIIYNPFASGFSNEKLYKIIDTLQEYNIKPYVEKSCFKGSVTKLVEDADEFKRLTITLGGDGTVSEAYEGLNKIEQKGVYAHIPTGTTNDMAKNFDIIRKKPKDIMEDILNGEITMFDTYSVNGHISAYTSVFGHLAHIPFITKAEDKKRLGYLAYILAAGKDLIKKPIKYNISFETDKSFGTNDFILGAVSNSKGFAGIDLYDDAKLDDGKIELLLIKDLNPKLIAELFIHFLKNDIDLNKYQDHLIYEQSSEIKLTFNDTFPEYAVDVDGEDSRIIPNYKDKDLIFKVEKPVRIIKRKQV